MTKINHLIVLLIFALSFFSTKIKTSNLEFEYNRFEILDTLVYTLNEINDPYSWYGDEGFNNFNKDGSIRTFAVIDLNDITNKESFLVKSKIKFYEDHVYHFYPTFTDIFYNSGILILHNGNYYIFHSLDCDNEGASKLEDVITFVSDSINNIEDREGIIERVRNYNDYNDYVTGFSEINYNCDREGND